MQHEIDRTEAEGAPLPGSAGARRLDLLQHVLRACSEARKLEMWQSRYVAMYSQAVEIENEAYVLENKSLIHFSEQLRSCLAQACGHARAALVAAGKHECSALSRSIQFSGRDIPLSRPPFRKHRSATFHAAPFSSSANLAGSAIPRRLHSR